MRGLTQNQNEAINQILWSKCPKTKFCQQPKVRLATCETITHFNTGFGSKAALMKYSGVVPHTNMLTAFRKADHLRLKNSSRKITVKFRLQRRKLRAKKKTSKNAKETYMAGGFGLGAMPEDVTGISQQKKGDQKRKVGSKNKKQTPNSKKQKLVIDFSNHDSDEVPITFIHD